MSSGDFAKLSLVSCLQLDVKLQVQNLVKIRHFGRSFKMYIAVFFFSGHTVVSASKKNFTA